MAKQAGTGNVPAYPLGPTSLPSPSTPQVAVQFLSAPPTIQKPKRIHPRHLLPLVREGAERRVYSTTRELRFSPRMAPQAAGDELKLLVNTELTQPAINRTASNVGEPSCAINGQTVLYTGNWYAALSTDGGATFRYMDPETTFPGPSPNVTFCCDQVVHFIPQIDMFVWLLQYGPDTGDNIQRLAFATTADLALGHFTLFDITTQFLGVPGKFLDFPDLAVGANYLYVTTNIFEPNGSYYGTAVVRIGLAGIGAGSPVAEPYVSTELQSFRVAQNCGVTAFFGAHVDTSTLAVFRWPEDQSVPARTDVAVSRWIGGNSGYVSRTPDGRRWLDRADTRLTGATMANNELWFAWNVDRRSNHRAQPFVQIARINADTLAVIENINVFDPESATAYGALSTNANGEVGISYMIGGGPRHPSHMVGILTGTRKDLLVSAGERSPQDPSGGGEWGDYLTVRPVPGGRLFAATGYTMKGQETGSNRDVTPRFVVFGRASDLTGVVVPAPPPSPTPPAPQPPTPSTTVDDLTTPFSDVNALPTVSPQVAATIKAACIAEGLKGSPAEMEMLVPLQMVTKPGVERWPVKTAADRDVPLVGKNYIDGQKLPTGIVDTTIEEMNRIRRPPDMRPPSKLFPKYQERRRGPVEFIVWRLECDIIGIKQEKDGDYHLVLQGASSKMLVAETPTARPPYVNATCPWLQNIKDARRAVEDKLIAHLNPQDFVQLDDILVPQASLSDSPVQPLALERMPASFLMPEGNDDVEMPTFQAKVKPTAVRITGVGFYDRAHGQTGGSPLNGIELHPVLKIEWL